MVRGGGEGDTLEWKKIVKNVNKTKIELMRDKCKLLVLDEMWTQRFIQSHKSLCRLLLQITIPIKKSVTQGDH